MKKVDVENKAQIKQLLYSNCVLGVKDDQYCSFGGFQLWWYDRQHDICSSCQKSWSDTEKKVEHFSLDGAAKVLWNNRKSLFLRNKQLSEDKKLVMLSH